MSIARQGRTTILGLLRDDARGWWAHDTRAQVNASVRNVVETFREMLATGGFVTVGRGGWTMHYRGKWGEVRRSGYGNVTEPDVRVAIKLGLPVIDTTTIPDDRITRWAIVGPMPGRVTSRFGTSDGEPYGSLDTVAVPEYAALAASFGATLYNVANLPAAPEARCATVTP